MKRVILGDSADSDILVELVMAIEELYGSLINDDGRTLPGTGLNRFRLPDGEVTVFIDAWEIDLVGPEELVEQILAALRHR